jgi:hypothetical protein
MVTKDCPRQEGRKYLRETVPIELWQLNMAYCDRLKDLIRSHKISRHPLIGVLNNETLNPEITRMIHLEFGWAFAQVFTDTIIHAMARSFELEQRLGPEAKVAARFLLQLNLLDELGFSPSEQVTGDYSGHPSQAHYSQFVETLRGLGASREVIRNFKPSRPADECRRTFTEQFGSYAMVTGVLACAESVFTLFAGPWAKSVSKSTNIDVSRGYHKIHVETDTGEFLDDKHSEDTWYLVSQAVTQDDYVLLRESMTDWLDTWCDFCDHIVHLARTIDRAQSSRHEAHPN